MEREKKLALATHHLLNEGRDVPLDRPNFGLSALRWHGPQGIPVSEREGGKNRKVGPLRSFEFNFCQGAWAVPLFEWQRTFSKLRFIH